MCTSPGWSKVVIILFSVYHLPIIILCISFNEPIITEIRMHNKSSHPAYIYLMFDILDPKFNTFETLLLKISKPFIKMHKNVLLDLSIYLSISFSFLQSFANFSIVLLYTAFHNRKKYVLVFDTSMFHRGLPLYWF